MRSFLKKIYLTIERWLLKAKSKKDILFVIENELMFKYAYLIYEPLLSDKRLRMSFCFVFKERSFSKEKIWTQIKGKSVPYWIAKRIKWDLIIYPNHGPYFRVDCPKIYIGHGLNSGKKLRGKEYLFGPRSLGEDGRIIYEKIFKPSEFVKARIKAHYPKFYSTVKVVGSLQGDKMIGDVIHKEKRLARLNLDASKRTILFASSWGPNALIYQQGAQLIERIPRLSKDYNIIISVHLNDYTQAHHQGINLVELFDSIRYENVYITKPGEGGHLVLPLADLLVTDMTALGLYFPPFKRPVIFYDNPNVNYDATALIPELKKASYVIKDVSTIQADIAKAFEDFDQSKMEELTKKIFSFQGQAWQRQSEEIYESLHLTPFAEGTHSLRVFKGDELVSHKSSKGTLTKLGKYK